MNLEAEIPSKSPGTDKAAIQKYYDEEFKIKESIIVRTILKISNTKSFVILKSI
jgi:hypothetical protein